MNNLENPDILSDEILNAIELIVKKCPTIVFGGSIALNAVGLINRKIGDIDVFAPEYDSLTGNGFMSIKQMDDMLSDTVTDTNGKLIQRTGAKIAGVKVCCFKVGNEELQHSTLTFKRSNKFYTLYIQNVNYAIMAKKII